MSNIPFDTIIGIVAIDVVEAKKLPAMDFNGKADPYCVFSLGTRTLHKTKIIYKTKNPSWNESFKVTIGTLETNYLLKIEVWDWDRGSKDDFIGNVEYEVSELFDKELKDVWLPIKGAKHNERGLLHLRMRLMNQQEVERAFWRAFAQHFDVERDNSLDRSQFMALLSSIAVNFSDQDIEALYEKADRNSDGGLDYDEVWKVLDNNKEVQERLFNEDPNLIWKIYAAADEFHTVGNLVVSRDLIQHDMKRNEIKGKVIMVHNRKTGQLEEEKIPHYVELALRIMYSTKSGKFAVQKPKVKKLLKHLTIVQGKKFDDPRSKKEIEPFIKFHVSFTT
jgi:hypothetical protein